MIESLNDLSLDERLQQTDRPSLLVFWAPWSQASQSLEPVWQDLALSYRDQLNVFKINIDENAHSPIHYAVKTIPHCCLVINGRIAAALDGRFPLAAYRSFVERHLAPSTMPQSDQNG